MNSPTCEVLRLGQVPYQEAWDLQARLAGQIASGERPPALLLLEHPHTYTFGRRGQAGNLLWDEAEQDRRGVSVFWVDRGGDVTYHGPGQLVGYPLLPLAPGGLRAGEGGDGTRIPQADYVGYVRRLEQTLILALAAFGVQGRAIEGLTGVWVEAPNAPGGQPAKIAAIGVKVDARGVSRHGFALNLQTDPVYWNGIIGCGLAGYPVANLADFTGSPVLPERVMDRVVEAFGQVFQVHMFRQNT